MKSIEQSVPMISGSAGMKCERFKHKRKYPWLLPLVSIFLVALFLFPVYWLIVTSLKSESEIFQDSAHLISKRNIL